MAELKRFKHWK